jgi:hypothetical protein
MVSGWRSWLGPFISRRRSGSAQQIPAHRIDPRKVPGVRKVLGWAKFGMEKEVWEERKYRYLVCALRRQAFPPKLPENSKKYSQIFFSTLPSASFRP